MAVCNVYVADFLLRQMMMVVILVMLMVLLTMLILLILLICLYHDRCRVSCCGCACLVFYASVILLQFLLLIVVFVVGVTFLRSGNTWARRHLTKTDEAQFAGLVADKVADRGMMIVGVGPLNGRLIFETNVLMNLV